MKKVDKLKFNNIMEYFIRHTDDIEISISGFEDLYKECLIGIHYTSKYIDNRDELLKDDAYIQADAKRALRYMNDLGKTGGYIWSDYSPISKSIIGKIEPNTQVVLRDYDLDPKKNSVDCKNNKLIMKCLKLSDVKEIAEDQFLFLKARRPQRGVIVIWNKSYEKLSKIFKGEFSINSVNDLTPDQLEILVFEYLRRSPNNKYNVNYLLMPIGRTMKDVDIYGVNKSGNKIFIQVTYSSDDKKNKIDALQKYKGKDSFLVYAGDVEEKEEGGIAYMNVRKIYDWMHKNTNIISLMETS
ncbi:hypothetical protein HGA88_07145 [Candidatus Roizmanbacteria bacterium]|nr:hypothetical protein [Candidatus Roizmanbacteria bacterium]